MATWRESRVEKRFSTPLLARVYRPNWLLTKRVRAADAWKAPSPADYLNARGTADYCGDSRVGLMQC